MVSSTCSLQGIVLPCARVSGHICPSTEHEPCVTPQNSLSHALRGQELPAPEGRVVQDAHVQAHFGHVLRGRAGRGRLHEVRAAALPRQPHAPGLRPAGARVTYTIIRSGHFRV